MIKNNVFINENNNKIIDIDAINEYYIFYEFKSDNYLNK